jgi:hypothetical protein
MKATVTRPVHAVEPFVPQWALRTMTRLRGKRLRRLFRAALERMNEATPDIPPEFFRYPFP